MLCNKCKDGGGVAGQAFKDWECHHCDKKFIHHNTAVPMYCPECSERLGRCEQCGALLPNINRVHCSNCKHYEFEEDLDSVHQWCDKGYDDADSIWNHDGLVCPDFEENEVNIDN